MAIMEIREDWKWQGYADLAYTINGDDFPYQTLFRRICAWDPQDRVGNAWLDDPLWRKMQIDPQQPSKPTTQVVRWPPPTVLEFTQKERFDLQARICASCATPNPQTRCGGASCESAYYCGQECADAHWPAHQCTNQVHPVLSSLSHRGYARDYYHASQSQNK